MQPSVSSAATNGHFLTAVLEGLTGPGQKRLPPQFFYDDVGSALFEAISALPEYGLTRADRRLLVRHSRAIADRLPADVSILELGSGTGVKTAYVLRAVAARQRTLHYFPIDVSEAALSRCVTELSQIGSVHAIEGSFLDGLRQALARIPSDQPALVLFLGSTIGNFDQSDAVGFLRELRSLLRANDRLLIGADLVKPVDQLLLAYDDPAGVTAAFNLNLLSRMNRELGANFNLRRFRHFARWDARAKRVEMHLASREAQVVRIAAADFDISFETGETIWTESSHKYEVADLLDMASACGFRPAEMWTDEEWPFAESLWIAAD
jgi:dimethylhistidine N-methyltransferase